MSFPPSIFLMQLSLEGPFLAIDGSTNLMFRENFSNPRTRFAIERAKSDSTLAHIRSLHNNKYWVAHETNGRVVIRASADEPVEDTKDPACTLFRPAESSHRPLPVRFSFRHVRRNMFVRDSVGLTLSTIIQEFVTVDWESLVILPSQVSFISEELKDHFAYSKVLEKRNYHRFDTGRDITNIRVAFELFPNNNGYYRIRNLHFDKYWRNRDVWIWAEAERNDNSTNTMFEFVDLGGGVFALRSIENYRFCGPHKKGKVNYLRAEFSTLTRLTRLLVHERVLERSISNIKYRFDDARIYQQEFVEVNHYIAANNTGSANEMTINFSIEESTTTSWKSSMTLRLGVKVQLRVTIVPVIVKGKLEARADYTYSQEWEEVKTTTIKRGLSYKVIVPPFTKQRVTLVCWRGVCDVPYSYTQQDLLPDGRRVSIIKDDGVFFGVNSFNFDIEATEVTEDALGRLYL